VTRERHARFNERRGVQLPPATHLPQVTYRVTFGTETVIMNSRPPPISVYCNTRLTGAPGQNLIKKLLQEVCVLQAHISVSR
jgi:hypothetical protein